MSNYEYIQEQCKAGSLVFTLKLNTSNAVLATCEVDEMVEIINCLEKPCHAFCHYCGEKDVPHSVCKATIKNWLLSGDNSSV